MSRKGRQFPAERKFDYAEAARLYRGGLSTVQIGKMLGVASNNIWRALKIEGIKLRSPGDGCSLRALGNKSKQTHGYVFVRLGKGRRQLEHVLIAQRALGRPLRKDEVVHHINCDPTDNRPENLLICSRTYHTELHWRMSQHPYWSQFQKRRNINGHA